MATYSYTAAPWIAVEENMQAAQQQLRTQLDKLESDINAHVAEWNDEAKDLYFQRKQEWNALAAQLPVKLGAVVTASAGMRDVLNRATQNATGVFGG
jgi:uncharacterized protein YukE